MRSTSSQKLRFQSTPPHGRRPCPPPNGGPPKTGFNPRLRTGGDMFRARMAQPFLVFQSTPPHGRRRPRGRASLPGNWFQSTPPHGRRPHLERCGPRSWQGFNPRLRTGGDDIRQGRFDGGAGFQSTPPHGRRRDPVDLRGEPGPVSIHASAREATVVRLLGYALLGEFQSTPPHGRRRFHPGSHSRRWPVSIHASAREATC